LQAIRSRPEGPFETEQANVPSGGEVVMSIPHTSARSRSRLAAALGVLALTAAVLAVAIEASSIRSTTIGSQFPRVVAQPAQAANADLPTSIRTPKGCRRRKFGCGQDATTTASPAHRSSNTAKGCWRRKFGCGHDATTTAGP
jgi:hypothetical protein